MLLFPLVLFWLMISNYSSPFIWLLVIVGRCKCPGLIRAASLDKAASTGAHLLGLLFYSGPKHLMGYYSLISISIIYPEESTNFQCSLGIKITKAIFQSLFLKVIPWFIHKCGVHCKIRECGFFNFTTQSMSHTLISLALVTRWSRQMKWWQKHTKRNRLDKNPHSSISNVSNNYELFPY